MPFRVSVSAQAADRLASARDLVRGCRAGTRVLIVGASRGAADDLARDVAASARATFGLERLSLLQLAARSAMLALAAEGRTPGTALGAVAVATRVAFDARRERALRFFEPVAAMPGFPRALARTLQELRLARVDRDALAALRPAGPDLSDLLERFEVGFEDAGSVDRAGLFRMAARVVRSSPPAEAVVVLDPVLDEPVERDLVEAIVHGARAALVTMPAADVDGIATLEAMGGQVEVHPSDGDTDLARLRTHLFGREVPPRRGGLDGSIELFSAPGEGRECVEIARRLLREARDGVQFDEMAILVRAPRSYVGLLEHALRRAGVPAWFGRGTRRPHPAGRAFLALLACAAERLSAARFAEYLSLGQVPLEPDGETWARAADEALGRSGEPAEGDGPPREDNEDGGGAEGGGAPGAPWRWERLLVEASVIGRDAGRWRRRLAGRRRELDRQIQEARRDDGGDAKAEALEALRAQLAHLEAFALPLIEEMAAWPAAASWGDWLDRFEALAPRVLRTPGHVLRVLGDLRPMASVGPVGIDEARAVLAERLLTVESAPPASRYGRVFVGTPQQARGRAFRVVFVPGLAERMFPERPREDPLLLDGARRHVDATLSLQPHRSASERLLLQVAVGAAAERLYVSYPRIELSESRARVPSFYALDVMRAVTGEVPDHEALEARARQAGDATLAWPSPTRPEDAIDDQEHDLAVLRGLLDEPDPDAVRGHAHYLLKLNPCLRRSVVDRWARGQDRWSSGDGLTRVTRQTAPALQAQRLSAREYSASALQLFATCPYRFLLSAVYRLRPLELPEPIQHMDPLTRGSLFHEIQARFFRELADQGALPVTAATVDGVRGVLDRVATAVCAAARDELVPAVERVWDHDVAAIRRDLHAWLDHLARDGEHWTPTYFELGFGHVPGERDVHSVARAAVVDGGFQLRGAVDLVEEHRQTGRLRVTDHKTGRRPDGIARVVVGGGTVLQPVLYSLAVEATLGRDVDGGRLFYCTSAGGFTEHEIPLDPRTRAAGLEVLQVVDRAVERGWLAASPADGACDRCDFRPVCGPDVGRRVSRKPREPLADLLEIRTRP